jgi:hypothetical protein
MNEHNLPTIPDDPFEAIKQLEKDLSLPKGFYRKLYKEDDWSFVIKLHSLIEAALSSLIIEALGHTQLSETISRLELSNNATGKIAFVKALNLVNEDHRRFIRKLSEIRNDFVHGISTVSIDLREYLSKPGKLEAATKAFCLGIERVEFDERKLSNVEYMREDPKYVIWMCGIVCLSVAYVKRLQAIHKRELSKVKERKLGQLEGLEMALIRQGIPIPERKQQSDD